MNITYYLFNDLSICLLRLLFILFVVLLRLAKLGIFEGSDAAWENADYYITWEGKREG